MQLPKRLTLEMAERIVADAVMVNLALITAFTLRFLAFFVSGGAPEVPLSYSDLFQNFVRSYRNLFRLLTLVCLVVFYLSGFYTYGRAYRSRYKALLILQAVSLSYLIFGFLTYFIRGLTPFPRSVLILAWLLTLALVGGLRIGAALFRRTVWAEVKIWGKPEKHTIRNVLVIGGAGYIGSVLVRKLLDRGYYVTVLDALLYGDEGIRDLYGRPQFELIHGDLRDVEAVVRAMQYADA
ncbi:MAG: GDP-mannose 4,6-dehydratase, partial [Candidatus Methanomethylicaceae archaeon]